MAAETPGGLYYPEPIASVENAQQLSTYMYGEFLRISATFEVALTRRVEFLHAAPERVEEGMVHGADGTNWNPGAGQGVYVYYNSTWNKLG